MPPGIQILLPDWIVAWIAVTAVVCLILERYHAALVLGWIPVGRWIVTPLLLDLLPPLPGWFLPIAGLTLLIFLVIFGPQRASRIVWNILLSKRVWKTPKI